MYLNRERKPGWTACVVYISPTAIVVSTALGKYIEGQVDLYEYGNVIAIVRTPSGEYSAAPIAPNSGRMRIYSRPLSRYILQKFECTGAAKLPAWRDNNTILFCKGLPNKRVTFHDDFSRITNPIRLRYENSVRIVGHRIFISAMLSKNLDETLSLYESGPMFALLNDQDGSLKTTDRNEFGTKAIRSPGLVRYVGNRLSTTTLYGFPIKSGVVFSNNRTVNEENIKLHRFHKIPAS